MSTIDRERLGLLAAAAALGPAPIFAPRELRTDDRRTVPSIGQTNRSGPAPLATAIRAVPQRFSNRRGPTP